MNFENYHFQETSFKVRARSNIFWFRKNYLVGITALYQKDYQTKFLTIPRSRTPSRPLNMKSVKLSHSCTQNMGSSKVRKNWKSRAKRSPTEKLCYCRNKETWPLNSKCLEPSLVYQADVVTRQGCYPYIGVTKGPFKKQHKIKQKYVGTRRQ